MSVVELAPGRLSGRDQVAVARRARADLAVAVALSLLFAAIAAVTWRKWGSPEIDAGAELSTAGFVAHGASAYGDVRYFYGPLGLYALAGAFRLFGTSFATAYAFGLCQAAAIFAAFYALSRRWLRPSTAGLATAVLIAIGFSGTAFNLVLPHTNSATIGILCLLLGLLALSHDRTLAAGVAFGLVGLTRPEYAAVAAGGALGYVIGLARDRGRGAALTALWRMALPGIAIPVVVLGAFASQVGASRLLTDNLWPTKFLHVAGFKTQSNWMPLTATSAIGLLLRAGVYGGALAGLVAASVRVSRNRGVARVAAAWPLAAVLACLVAGDALLRATGIAAIERSAVEDECRHLILGMSWLPALGVAAAAWAALRFLRRGRPLLSDAWAADLALLIVAAGLGLRAYNAFTAEGSYAPYYAAPLVLLLGILHERTGDRWPTARRAVQGALGAVAAGLAAYALLGLYADDTTPVHTPRGTFVTTSAAAPALQRTIATVDGETRAGQRILAAPADGGLYFMTDRPPALRELMLLPGLIYSPGDERAAIARLRREHVPLAVVGARDFSAWGWRTWGRDYNRVLGAWLRSDATSRETLGTLAQPVAGTYPSKGFELYRLKH